MKARHWVLVSAISLIFLALSIMAPPAPAMGIDNIAPPWATHALDPIEGADVHRTIYSASRPKVRGRNVTVVQGHKEKRTYMTVLVADNRSWVIREL